MAPRTPQTGPACPVARCRRSRKALTPRVEWPMGAGRACHEAWESLGRPGASRSEAGAGGAERPGSPGGPCRGSCTAGLRRPGRGGRIPRWIRPGCGRDATPMVASGSAENGGRGTRAVIGGRRRGSRPRASRRSSGAFASPSRARVRTGLTHRQRRLLELAGTRGEIASAGVRRHSGCGHDGLQGRHRQAARRGQGARRFATRSRDGSSRNARRVAVELGGEPAARLQIVGTGATASRRATVTRLRPPGGFLAMWRHHVRIQTVDSAQM